LWVQALGLATAVLHAVIAELEPLEHTASHLPALLSKVWRHLSDVQYLCGRSHLQDVTKAPEQRHKDCIEQLEKILHAKEMHPRLQTATLRLEGRTLRRLGMCHMFLLNWEKAIEAFEKLLALEQVLAQVVQNASSHLDMRTCQTRCNTLAQRVPCVC
jgi:tetratricopeptide (TPR) repeat protein